MIITNSDRQLIPFFKEKEFYGSSAGGEHYFDDRLVQAAAYIRQTYGQVVITSTYRSPQYNAMIGGAPRSQHVKGKAMDFKVNQLQSLQTDLETKGAAYQYLRAMKISGFGLYDTFIHLDTRDQDEDAYTGEDSHGRFSFWDNRKKKGINKIIPIQDPEDGYKGQQKQVFITMGLFIAFITTIGIIMFKKLK